MADEHDKVTNQGRRANAAQPLNSAKDNAGAERYPPVRQDDAVEDEDRSFTAGANPKPRQGAGDASTPPAASEGLLGPAGDPAEGKP